MFQKLDLWLRGLWVFWDSHGTRLLGIAGFIHAAIGAVISALHQLDPNTASVWMAISALFGAMTIGRGQNNARKE